MTSQFDRWEKDPFFPAAEQVQESADRYTYIHSYIFHNFLMICDFDLISLVIIFLLRCN